MQKGKKKLQDIKPGQGSQLPSTCPSLPLFPHVNIDVVVILCKTVRLKSIQRYILEIYLTKFPACCTPGLESVFAKLSSLYMHASAKSYSNE